TGVENQPSRIVQVDESVSMALLLLLERVTPVERAVYLLQDIFDYTHAEIAKTLDLTEANCRQLLHRAREHVRLARPRFKASEKEHRGARTLSGGCGQRQHGQFTGPSLSRRRSSFGWRWQSAGVPASNLRT